jgi:hypothetical protein
MLRCRGIANYGDYFTPEGFVPGAGTLYAFAMRWPGRSLLVRTVQPEQGADVRLLGFPGTLSWRHTPDGLQIDILVELEREERRPCQGPWCFRLSGIGG